MKITSTNSNITSNEEKTIRFIEESKIDATK